MARVFFVPLVLLKVSVSGRIDPRRVLTHWLVVIMFVVVGRFNSSVKLAALRTSV